MPVRMVPIPAKRCAICHRTLPKLKRVYCSDACFDLGRRDYQCRWQRQPEQKRRVAKWYRAHRKERAHYNHEHFMANRDRYLAGMRRRYLRATADAAARRSA